MSATYFPMMPCVSESGIEDDITTSVTEEQVEELVEGLILVIKMEVLLMRDGQQPCFCFGVNEGGDERFEISKN